MLESRAGLDTERVLLKLALAEQQDVVEVLEGAALRPAAVEHMSKEYASAMNKSAPRAALELRVQNQERHTAEVIVVQVREDDGVEGERIARAGFEVDAGLEAAAAAEGVAASLPHS